MGTSFKLALKNIPGLFYVTSTSCLEGLDDQLEGELKNILADLPHIILKQEKNALDAAKSVRLELQKAQGIKGVVILGDYTQVPSHALMSIDPALYHRMEKTGVDPGNDWDRWWVWNDDIYGCVKGKFDLPDLPVSRLPTIPATTNAPYVLRSHPSIYGLRSSEFSIAEKVYHPLAAAHVTSDDDVAVVMEVSPKAEANSANPDLNVSVAELMSDLVYLVVHGADSQLEFKGGNGVRPIAVSKGNVGGARTRPSVVFGGICYGALTAKTKAKGHRDYPTAVLHHKPLAESIALQMVDLGVNAFVSFTSQHQLPKGEVTDMIFGAPLHKYFWENIVVEKMAPAEALFRAKAKTVMSLDSGNTSPLNLSKTLKAVWSATCIGLGW